MKISIDTKSLKNRYGIYINTGFVLPMQIDITFPIPYHYMLHKPGVVLEANPLVEQTKFYLVCEVCMDNIFPKYMEYKRLFKYMHIFTTNILSYEYTLNFIFLPRFTSYLQFLIPTDCKDYEAHVKNIMVSGK